VIPVCYVFTTSSSSSATSKKIRAIPIASTTSSCPPYGCPSYPLNYNDESAARYYKETVQRYIETNGLRGVFNSGTDVVSMTRDSNQPHPNQDRMVVIKPFWRLEKDYFLAAIFDGHGEFGHVVAEHAQKEAPRILSLNLDLIFEATPSSSLLTIANNKAVQEQVKRALIDTFRELDATAPPNYSIDGGCTGSLILKLDDAIFIANAGDSRSFIATVLIAKDNNNLLTVNVPYITRRDKPHLPDEKERIEKMGGKINTPKPPKPAALSRVIAWSPRRKENIALAMSRSIGDSIWTKIGVIPDPIVDVVYISDLKNKKEHDDDDDEKKKNDNVQLFAVVGSDGIFDARTKEFVAKFIADSLYDRKNGDYPILMAYKLIEKASPMKESFYRDDISFAAVQFG